MRIEDKFTEEHEGSLLYPKEQYRLTSDSLFIDIGAGFGKPVFHAAMQANCFAMGVEVVPARVEYCIDFNFEWKDLKKKEWQKLKAEGKSE